MINCPKCNKEIADESAHCGYCGQEIKAQAEKKTMFGMAALDSDMLKKAVEEAREAKKEGNQPAKGLKIPAPGASAKPAADASTPQTPGEAEEDIGLAQTEMLSFSPEDQEELANLSSTAPLDEVSSPADPPHSGEAPTLMESPWDESNDAPLGSSEAPQAPFGASGPEPDQPVAPAAQTAPVGGFDQPAAGADQQVVPAPQAPEKSKTGLIIAIAAVVVLFGGGCFFGLAWYAYSAFMG